MNDEDRDIVSAVPPGQLSPGDWDRSNIYPVTPPLDDTTKERLRVTDAAVQDMIETISQGSEVKQNIGKVWIVEKDPKLFDALAQLFEEKGYNVCTVSDMNRQHPGINTRLMWDDPAADLIILGDNSQQQGESELADRLLKHNPYHIPVLLIDDNDALRADVQNRNPERIQDYGGGFPIAHVRRSSLMPPGETPDVEKIRARVGTVAQQLLQLAEVEPDEQSQKAGPKPDSYLNQQHRRRLPPPPDETGQVVLLRNGIDGRRRNFRILVTGPDEEACAAVTQSLQTIGGQSKFEVETYVNGFNAREIQQKLEESKDRPFDLIMPVGDDSTGKMQRTLKILVEDNLANDTSIMAIASDIASFNALKNPRNRNGSASKAKFDCMAVKDTQSLSGEEEAQLASRVCQMVADVARKEEKTSQQWSR